MVEIGFKFVLKVYIGVLIDNLFLCLFFFWYSKLEFLLIVNSYVRDK